MLAQRVATALVLMAILLPSLFWFPPLAWGLVSLAFLSLAAWEWAQLLEPRQRPWLMATLVLVVGLVYLYCRETGLVGARHAWMVVLVLTLFWAVDGGRRLARGQARGGGWPLAVLLLLGAWYAMYELREISVVALLSSMAVVWVADIAAYFVGRAFGRRKLAPAISPGKSWEGAIGGAFFVVIFGLLLAAWPMASGSLPNQLVAYGSPLVAIPVLLGLTALSVVGDLHESLLKRQAGVKDSGRTLPGHGGVLDRVDALIPVMPACLLIMLLAR